MRRTWPARRYGLHVSYDEQTEFGGPPQTRETSQLEITKLTVGPMENNTYLLRDRASGATLLIDAAFEEDRIVELCGGKLDAVLTTHCHPDHWQALVDVVTATGATTYAGETEAPLIPAPTDVLVHDGDSIDVGTIGLTAVELTGHRRTGSDHICTSIALIHRDTDGSAHVFTGDCLFPGGVGNTCDDPVAFTTLLNDVATKLFGKLPDNTTVYPGHGFDTTIGTERPMLATWATRHW